MSRKCPRTLDKPLLLFGLEIEDIGLLILLGGVGSIFFGPLIPGALSMVGAGILVHFKKDKPAGYLLHWLYSKGLEIPGLLAPIGKVKYYGVYGKSSGIKKITLH